MADPIPPGQRAVSMKLTGRARSGSVGATRRLGLIIVDAQLDFCEGGALAVPGGGEVIPLLNRMRAEGDWSAVVLTQDWHPPDHKSFASNNAEAALFSVVELPGIGPQMMWPNHCVQNSAGAQFHPQLERAPGDHVVQKGTHAATDSYSGFGDASADKHFEKTPLERILREAGVTDVFVGGLATDYCVSYTCKDAALAGFNTFCVLPATRHIAPESLAEELAAMRKLGVHIVESVDDVPAKATLEALRREDEEARSEAEAKRTHALAHGVPPGSGSGSSAVSS
jgi:nicotinamidase/pyrazinamidase